MADTRRGPYGAGSRLGPACGENARDRDEARPRRSPSRGRLSRNTAFQILRAASKKRVARFRFPIVGRLRAAGGHIPEQDTFGVPVPPLDARPPRSVSQDFASLLSAACAPPGVTSPNKIRSGPLFRPSTRGLQKTCRKISACLLSAACAPPGVTSPNKIRSGPLFRPSTRGLQEACRKISLAFCRPP